MHVCFSLVYLVFFKIYIYFFFFMKSTTLNSLYEMCSTNKDYYYYLEELGHTLCNAL